jgi:alpha-L-fucosidase
MNRRQFAKLSTLGLASAALPGRPGPAESGPASSGMTADVAAAERGAWFVPARYGRFIHFGLYALLGRGEWQMYLEQIPPDEYAKLKDRFNPSEFNAREWVDLARQAGQRYITITSKHHEGFAMFNTKLSSFSIMHTPFGRDLCGELAEECHRQGMVISFYFSLMDWHSPLYRPSLKAGTPVSGAFVDFMHGQVRELCTNYGKLGAIWFDGGWDHTPTQWQSEKLIAMIRQLQPDALINNRTGLPADFSTPEEAIGEINKPGRLWENCNTTNDAWGYDAMDQRFKSPREILELLVKAVAGGGNLLLNVGPLPTGKIDPVSTAHLNEVGEWLVKNGASIYGATSFRQIYYDNVYTTRKGDTVYLHIFDWKPGAGCDLWQLNMKSANRAYFLETQEPVKLGHSHRMGVRLTARNTNPKPLPDTVIVFEGVEPLGKAGA